MKTATTTGQGQATPGAASFWATYLMIAVTGVLLIAPAVFAACLVIEGYSIGGIGTTVVAQYQADRQNLLLVGLPAIIPFAILGLVLLLVRRWRGREGSGTLAAGGAIGIVVTLLWANTVFWPLYLPGRAFPGFPHGLEMVIAPLFFAPVAMLVGLLAGWLVLCRS